MYILRICRPVSTCALRPRGYKIFFKLSMKFFQLMNLKLLTIANSFLLNIDEISPANESQITNNCKFFLLNIDDHNNFSANKYDNANYCWRFHIY